jgi:hypothetical protein
MMAKGATASAVNPDWAAMFGSLLNAETLGMATFVYAVAFVAFWLGWYAPAPILSRSIARLYSANTRFAPTASGSTSPAHPSVPRLPAPRVHRKIRSFRPPKQERFSTTAHVIRALNDETYDQSILTQANLAKICGMLPKWITFPEKDRVPWLNRAAQQWWPFLNRAISNSVVDAVEPILNKLVQGSPIRNLHFSKFTLGTEPLVFASVACVDDVPNEVGLDIEFKWVAKEPEVQLDVSLLGMVLPIAIDKLEAFGTVRIVFGPLCDWWPAFSDMQVAFIGKPKIDLDLRLIGGDITKFPVVERLLMNLIKNVLTKLMTWPNRLDIQITEDQGARCTARAGIVRITIKRGTNMSKGNALGGSVFSTKATPAVEIVAIDGEFGAPKTTRVSLT